MVYMVALADDGPLANAIATLN